MADTSTAINFPLSKLVSDARSTYGLRHQDYGRYKSHCVAKVHHLRKSIGLTQTAGKTRKYQKKDVLADKVSTDKHLQIVLFDAERCWAQSHLLKASLNDPSASASTKHHFAKRLSKASSRAGDLLSLVQSPALSSRLTAAHVGQVQAYHLVLLGSLAFERGKHDEGLRTLSAAYKVLAKLAATAESATEEALANEMADEVEPMLRFCAYRLGKNTAAGVGVIAQEVAAESLGELVPGWEVLSGRLQDEEKKSQKEVVEVRWRGEVVPVRNVELVRVAVKVKEALAALVRDEAGGRKGGEGGTGKQKAEGKVEKEVMGTRRMGAYDQALLVLSDAETVASQVVEDNKIALSKNSSRSEVSSRPAALFLSYISYHLFSVRTKRDLLLISSTLSKLASREAKIEHAESAYIAKTQTRDPSVTESKIARLRAKTYPGLVKVYDSVLIALEGMRDMEEVEKDDELATKVEARIAWVRAERCKYLSRGHALATPPSFPSSLSLNARAKLYSRQARSTARSLPSPDEVESEEAETQHDFVEDVLPLSPSSSFNAALDVLDTTLEADYENLSRRWFAATGGAVENADLPSMEDLSISPSVAASDPAKGKQKKGPPFYDVAYNYVTAFDLDAIAVKAGLRAAPQDEETKMQVEHEEARKKPQEQAQQETPKKRGWGFGLFGR
ncbi:hypothetical protein JCM11641_001445 [Rhodosporidiobolus odoratus]